MQQQIKGKVMAQDILDNIPKYCILSGSRGFGVPNENSDYDFYVPESKWESFKQWFYPFAKLHGLQIDSCVVGHLSFRISELHSELFEFSYLFPKTRQEYQETNLTNKNIYDKIELQ